MRAEARRLVPALLAGAALAGCAEKGPAPIVGALEWDRIAVTAELAEPVLSWAVAEGDRVEAGAVILELDARRQDARIAEARAELAAMRSAVCRGDARRAHRDDRRVARQSRAGARGADRRRDRVHARRGAAQTRARRAVRRGPGARGAQPAPRRDVRPPRRSCASSRRARGRSRSSTPRRPFRPARAALATLELTRERLTVRAPRAGRVDALPFRAGDQPPVGAELVSMLVGDTPYARVFVPAPQRAQLKIGARFEVRVEGVATPFPATLRSIRSEPSFTPYYALAGDDASRLVYQAELLLDGGADLPAGLPVTAVPLAP